MYKRNQVANTRQRVACLGWRRLRNVLPGLVLLAGCRSEKATFHFHPTASYTPQLRAVSRHSAPESGPDSRSVQPLPAMRPAAPVPAHKPGVAVRRGPSQAVRPRPGIRRVALAPRIAVPSRKHPATARALDRRADPGPGDYTQALLLLLGAVATVAALLIGITGLLTATGTADLLVFGAILLAGLVPVIILLVRAAQDAHPPAPSPPPATPATPGQPRPRPKRPLSRTSIGLLVIGGFVVLAPVVYLLLSKP